MGEEYKIVIQIDIKNEQPHKTVRLYSPEGIAIGFGEQKVNETLPENTLFGENLGSVSYGCSIDIEKLKAAKEEFEKRTRKRKEEKTSYIVKETDNKKEDEWVQGMIKQEEEVGHEITLTMEEDFRERYREIQQVKKGDISLSEVKSSELVTKADIMLETTFTSKGEQNWISEQLKQKTFKSADEGYKTVKELRAQYQKLHTKQDKSDDLSDFMKEEFKSSNKDEIDELTKFMKGDF